MSTAWWTTRIAGANGGDGPTVAVKDLIDVVGTPTTGACRILAATATPATADAPVVAALRGGGARIVAKSVLQELAFGLDGRNAAFGTPTNPADPRCIPGGSSSGSAVAVGCGDVDLALGTDTGGSIRIPAACCGVTGLKTTWGRLPLDGVLPLALSMDTVGPLARDNIGIARAMDLLEPGFAERVSTTTIRRIGRLRMDHRPGDIAPPTSPGITGAIDAALVRVQTISPVEIIDVDLDLWAAAADAALTVLFIEVGRTWGHLLHEPHASVGGGLLLPTVARLAGAVAVDPAQEGEARQVGERFAAQLLSVFEAADLDVIVTPVLVGPVPFLDGDDVPNGHFTRPLNLIGSPALAMPVTRMEPGTGVPASVQIVARHHHDETVVAMGRLFEAAQVV